MRNDPIIQRCPHDEENPYTQTSNLLIRDKSISPNCRMILIFLLANRNNWSIRMSHLYNEFKEYIGRDCLYNIINEAIQAGYILREEFKEGNLKRYKYYLSEKPKFKKCFRYPENQEAENKENLTEIKCPHNDYSQFPDPQDPEKQGSKERTIKEITNNNNKGVAPLTPPVVVPSFIQEIEGITQKEKKCLAEIELKTPGRVNLAIEWAKTQKIKTTLMALIRWHAERDIERDGEIKPVKKKGDPDTNKAYAKEISKQKLPNGWKIEVLNKYINISSDKYNVSYCIEYKDFDFEEKTYEIIEKIKKAK